MKGERVPIARKNGVTLYGRMVNPITKKLGHYEVISDYLGSNGIVYLSYAEAEDRYNYLQNLLSKQV